MDNEFKTEECFSERSPYTNDDKENILEALREVCRQITRENRTCSDCAYGTDAGECILTKGRPENIVLDREINPQFRAYNTISFSDKFTKTGNEFKVQE